MKSTREKILRTLLAFPGSTINDLAEAVGINGISIRHHLTSLEAEDLVSSAEERHGVGRPRLIYTLTDKGVEEFPTSYLRLTKRLLVELKQRLGNEEVKAIFKNIGQEMAAQYADNPNDQPLETRMRHLKSVLTQEGFIIDYVKNENGFILTSLSCPYYKVGLDHPEICILDQQMISEFLAVPVEIQSCILNGADRCTYHIPLIREETKK